MPASLEQQQLAVDALAKLRQRENPFAAYVATLDDDHLRYDVPEFLAEQRDDVKSIVEMFRNGDRVSQIVPVLGDFGSGKTHLLSSLRKELDTDQQLFVISEGFPKDRDTSDFFLWQIVHVLMTRRKTSMKILSSLSDRVTSRLLSETLRRLPPNKRLDLVPSNGFFDSLGRKFGFQSAVEAPLKRAEELLKICESENFAEAISAAWSVGVSQNVVLEAIEEHLNREESLPDSVVRRTLYKGMVTATIGNRIEELQEFLTGGFRELPEHVVGAGDITKRLLRVLLELFATFRLPVIVAFDQLEDFLRSGSPEEAKSLQLDFCQRMVALANAVPNLCILLFVERGLWNSIITVLDQYAQDRLHRDLGLPGKPSRREISLPEKPSLEHLTAIIRARVGAVLGDLDRTDQLSPTFPFSPEVISEIRQENSVRACLQGLCKAYAAIVYSEEMQKGQSPAEIHEYLDKCWTLHRDRANSKIEDLSAANIPFLTDALKFLLDFWTNELKEPVLWVKCEVLQQGHELFGHLILLRPGPRSAGMGIGFWLAELKHRPSDLAAKLAFLHNKPVNVRRLVIFRRDGLTALRGVSGEHFEKEVAKGYDVTVQELTDADLAVILGFPQWLKAANGFLSLQPENMQEAAQDARNDIVRERSKSLVERIKKWQCPETEEPSP